MKNFEARDETGKEASIGETSWKKKSGFMRIDRINEQLTQELNTLYQRIAELESSESRRKRVEEELRHEKELLDALMNTARDSIYFKDRQFRLIRINRKMMQDLDLDDVSQAVRKTDIELFGEEFARRTRFRCLSVLIGRETECNPKIFVSCWGCSGSG